jgi:hypothetical protein
MAVWLDLSLYISLSISLRLLGIRISTHPYNIAKDVYLFYIFASFLYHVQPSLSFSLFLLNGNEPRRRQ